MAPLSLSSRPARVGAAAMWLVLGVAWGGALTQGVSAADLPAALGTVNGVVLSWLVLWKPRVVVTEDSLDVVNPLRQFRIPWPSIIHIETTWAMRIHTPSRIISAWSVVSPGRHAGFWASKDQATHLPPSSYHEGTLRPGDLIGTESGEITAIVRRAWESGRDRTPSSAEVEAHWSAPAIWVAAVSTCGLIVAAVAAGVSA